MSSTANSPTLAASHIGDVESEQAPELKASAPLVRRYQFVNNIVRLTKTQKLRAYYNNKSMNHIRKPYDIAKPLKIPNLTQKEVLTEKVSKLLGHATLRERREVEIQRKAQERSVIDQRRRN